MQAFRALFTTKARKVWALDTAALKAALKEPFKATTLDGITRIVAHKQAPELSRAQLAYVLATVWHETAGWCAPIREGAFRYGPNYSDAAARAAVASLYAKGLITRNYALPDKRTGKSYYGRGLVQITWYDEYKQIGAILGIDLVSNPDRALEWPIALDILYTGMVRGTFREGNSLSMVQSPDDWVAARNIINGDRKKNGALVAKYAAAFYAALK